ncbi:hypothetical protein ZIOFF_048350 [Zingiber officinale]|uniref:Reverse transcriptase Ty1/copia-type domain-containing protein n=1 Tax=Zingiber officinale TaxID=94328 RepID=A0A8J5KS52_ZINOF|nr:hypothetical protein ZIOFF_048350 [Zingiber officinale]
MSGMVEAAELEENRSQEINLNCSVISVIFESVGLAELLSKMLLLMYKWSIKNSKMIYWNWKVIIDKALESSRAATTAGQPLTLSPSHVATTPTRRRVLGADALSDLLTSEPSSPHSRRPSALASASDAGKGSAVDTTWDPYAVVAPPLRFTASVALAGNNTDALTPSFSIPVKIGMDTLAMTYFDDSDTSQVYDLRLQMTRLKQASGSLEKFYLDLQGLWREIDIRRPNLMECPGDIQRYNSLVQEDRVCLFLDGLDDHLDNIRSDILQLQLLSNPGSRSGPRVPPHVGSQSSSGRRTGPTTKALPCSHYGRVKHSRDNYFKLHGYPNWWHDLQAHKRKDSSGQGSWSSQASGLSKASLIDERDVGKEDSSFGLMDILTKEIIGRGTKREGLYYMDDFINGDDSEGMTNLERRLAIEFEMKNLRGLKYFLGIEVARSKQDIFLSQRKYVLDLLAEVGLLDYKPMDTPIIQNHRLGEYTDQVPIDKGRYYLRNHKNQLQAMGIGHGQSIDG